MYRALKKKVWEANLSLPDYGLVTFTWGNVSEIDRGLGVFAIKPSGVSYESMTPEDMVVLDLSGNILEGSLTPSSDTPTHLELYRAFPKVNGVVHTHSKFATIWAQAGTDIPVLGTTHADYFYGDIPCTRALSDAEIMNDYEKNTGKVIVETFLRKSIEPLAVPAVIISEHGPFCWGKSGKEAVQNAVVLEEISMMALNTITINPRAKINHLLLDKHYQRKHGLNAYYGQK